MNFFEEVGLLVKRGYLDPTDTWEMFSSTIFPLYTAVERSVADNQIDDANTFRNFVNLHHAAIPGKTKGAQSGAQQMPNESLRSRVRGASPTVTE